MEILSGHSGPSCQQITLTQKFPEKSLGSFPPKFSRRRKQKFVCDLVRSEVWSLQNSLPSAFHLSHYNGTRRFMSLDAIKGVEGVIDVEESLENVSKRKESIPKVLVPGLPDDSKGDLSAPVSSGQWEWKPKFNIHYERSGSRNTGSPQVLFLPGFGVGSFHYEKQLKDLGRDFGVWAMDFLGQGMSLPGENPTLQPQNDGESQIVNPLWGFGDETEPWADDLVYSIDLWQEQVRYFIEEVIKEPVYIVGNSLGGYVALYFASCNPHLVKGVTLLNATPFWGFFPNPERSPILSQMFPSAGAFPLPPRVRKIMEVVWEKMRDPRSIREILKQVYADHSTNVDKVFSRILEITEHPAALASFASIMLAPQGKISFGEALSRCKTHDIPICLMYGKEDPWVRPVWGQQVKRQLPEAPYYQISPAGHCPHDEVPEVVNYLLRGWIKNLESEGFVALPLLDDESGRYDVAKDLEYMRDGTKRSVRVLLYGSEFSMWSKLSSLVNTQLESLTMKFR
ncbi:pheophytinase, chloroplastic [Cynara cardunculus var. scolymus]|nr:pheophytinase, chloroplastic [Cynara cardunculus var. scolymus]